MQAKDFEQMCEVCESLARRARALLNTRIDQFDQSTSIVPNTDDEILVYNFMVAMFNTKQFR